MPFITLGTASQLQIKVPTIGSTDWADTMRTDTFLKIAQHQHTGAGDGAQLGTGSILADAVTGAKIRLANDEFLKARNAADSANINIVKVDTNDDAYFEAEVANMVLKQNTYLLGRNAADSGNVNLLKIDANDDLAIDPDISKLNLKNATYLTGRNNADSADVNLLRINTSDKLEIAAEIGAVLKMSNNTYIQGRNNADSAYVDMFKVRTDDKIQVGANILAATIETATTSKIVPQNSVVLADNTAVATSTSVISLGADESCLIRYRLLRNGVTQEGTLQFTDADTVPAESYTGTAVGVTFSVNAGDLEYTTTSTGNAVSMFYTILT